jgi:hypothetical protein
MEALLCVFMQIFVSNRQQISNHSCLQTNRLKHVLVVSMYVTHRHVVNKKLFSHKGLRTFWQAFRGGVSKQRALPTSSRVILSYHSLQMTYLCRTMHETWFHAVTIAGFYTSVPEGESWGYRTLWRQNGAKVACHSILNVLPPTSNYFIIFTLAVSVPVTLSHWCSTDFHQTAEVYTTQNSVSRKRSWYITDTTNWCYNGYWVFPGDKADECSVATHIHLAQRLQQ